MIDVSSKVGFDIVKFQLFKIDKLFSKEVLIRSKNHRDRKKCRSKGVKFFVANDLWLTVKLSANGIYLSAKNTNFNALNLKRTNFEILGAAHNIKELNLKKNQGCKDILFSRLFQVSYKTKMTYLGVNKFNRFLLNIDKNIFPLGGINYSNLNNLKNIKSCGFAIMTEVKKKPAIISRLF